MKKGCAIPILEKCCPPQQVSPSTCIEANVMVGSSVQGKELKQLSQECAALGNDCMLQHGIGDQEEIPVPCVCLAGVVLGAQVSLLEAATQKTLVSMRIPRKPKAVVGPSVLWLAMGIPSTWNILTIVASASAACLESGAPSNRKSSR